MKSFLSRVFGRQLSRPSGLLGILVGEIMSAGNKEMYVSSLGVLGLANGDVLLEIGFGNGEQISQILAGIQPGKYFGIELSETMLEQAIRKNKKTIQQGSVFLESASEENLPFEADYFDKILTVNTIYFWHHPEKMMLEIFRVLKPRGRVVVTFNTKEFLQGKRYTKNIFDLVDGQTVKTLFEKAGFINIRSHYEILKHQDALSIYGEKP